MMIRAARMMTLVICMVVATVIMGATTVWMGQENLKGNVPGVDIRRAAICNAACDYLTSSIPIKTKR